MLANAKRQQFCEEFVVDLNATQAAKRAGYSPKTAYAQGQRLLKDAEVQAEIARLQAARSEKTGVTAIRVLQELVTIALHDPADAFDFTGETPVLKKASEIPESSRRAIAGFRYSKDGVLQEVKFWSKDNALQLIGKHLGMFLDKLEVSDKTKLVLTEEIVDAEDSPPNDQAAPGPG